MDWMIWLVAALFYIPLHLGLPAGWLFYRLLDHAAAARWPILRRFLWEGALLLLLTIAVAAGLWWLGWPAYSLLAWLVVASLLPFWRAAVLARRKRACAQSTGGNG